MQRAAGESVMARNGDQEPRVLQLACARFEDAVADGRSDPWTEGHRQTCAACDRLARETADVARQIAEATRPRTVSADFSDRVLARAAQWGDVSDLDSLGPGTPPSPPSVRRTVVPRWTGFGLAAALLLGFWLGTANPWKANAPGVAPRVAVPEAPGDVEPPRTAAAPAQALSADTPRAGAAAVPMKRVLPAAPAEPEPVPVAVVPNPVPEPALDVPGELRAAIVREVSRLELCPEHIATPVRVTVGIEPDGRLTNRQIMSAAGQTAAHTCVSYATDALLLPPLRWSGTVTIDVSW